MQYENDDLEGELQHIINHGTLKGEVHLSPSLVALIQKNRRWPTTEEYPPGLTDYLGTTQAKLRYEGLRLGLKGLDEIDDYLIAECGLTYAQLKRMSDAVKLERLKARKTPAR